MRFIESGLRACPADDGAGSAPLARRQTGAAGRKWRWSSGPTARETFNGDGFITTRDNPATPENDVEIMQENHYYPFDMNHDGRWFGPQDPENRYTYNGKEYTPELGLDWYDYGARWYDAALGRWGQVDPMAEEYTSLSSYAYVANNPLIYLDIDGMRIVIGGQEWIAGTKYAGDSDSFASRMFNILNNIAMKSQSGGGWLNGLAISDFEFRIELDNDGGSRFEPDNEPEVIKDSMGIPIGITIPKPGGGTVFINEQDSSNTEKGVNVDLEANLAHELIGHGIDANRGEIDHNPQDGFLLDQAEYTATERENIVRAEMDKPLRVDYSGHRVITKDRNGVKAIPSGNLIRESKKYKKP